jgi:CubicO group peptidase (beta-lactamase class C family)
MMFLAGFVSLEGEHAVIPRTNLMIIPLMTLALSAPAGAGTEAGSTTRSAASMELEAVVREVADTAFTPGIAVAVVRPGAPIWSTQVGYADRERSRPVLPDTRFYIASTTKALTALAALRVAERGQIDLDAPLSRVFPAARFAGGLSGDSIRVRDLLTHTHGIDPETPISLRVAFTGDYTNRDLIGLLGSCKAAKGGRAFRYSNLGYDLVGIVLAPDQTHGWKDVVAREVLEPAGMAHTTAYRSQVPESRTAWPYETGPNGWERVALAKEDSNMGPAGGHFSTAADLARLVMLELTRGRLDGAQVFPAELIERSQRLEASQDRPFGPFRRFGWGFGWDLGTYEGDTLLHRPGSFNGYFSHVSFMPRHGIGVVILVNGGRAASGLTHVVSTAIYDHLLGRGDAAARRQTALTELRGRMAKAREAMIAERAERAARAAPLSLPLAAYAGRYSNPLFGTLELKLQDGGLRARMGVAESPIEIYDASKNQLRIELFGGGTVVEAIVAAGARHPTEMRMLDATFARR